MYLQNKDILVVIGPARTGKGTLLSALGGEKIEFLGCWRDSERISSLRDNQEHLSKFFMAPVDRESGHAKRSLTISHKTHPHTFKPTIPYESAEYSDNFKELNGVHLVDFPGLFD